MDDVWKFYKDKVKWFKARISSSHGKLKEFEEAKIKVFGHEERLRIKYKGKLYGGRIVLNKKPPSDYMSYTIEDWFNLKDN